MSVTTDFDIRLVSSDEPANITLSAYAFQDSPRKLTNEDWHRGKYLADSRTLMSFDGDTPVAKATTHMMTLNVRGRVLPMGGVGGVASMPAGRRGGRVRALMLRSFEQMREDGQPVSTLYPFRESFYERLGFVSFPCPKFATVDPANLAPLVRMECAGSTEHRLIADGFDQWAGFLETYQTESHGFAMQPPSRLEGVRDQNSWWLVLVHEGEEITGAMTYRITGHLGVMRVETFLSRTTSARYQLLGWIARHVDQVEKARIRVSPDEMPEFWFRDLDDAIRTDGEDSWGAPMGRIISIDGLTGIGAGDGEVTVEIADEQCPWNAGVWTLRGSGGVLEVQAGGTPSGNITIQGLSALLFNGLDTAILPFRGWGEVEMAASVQLRALFPPAMPYLHEQF